LNASGPGEVGRVGKQSGAVSGHLRLLSLPSDAPDNGSARSTCSTVASGLSDEVASALRKAMDGWTESGDRSGLRRELLALLMLVETDG
jgi:hypothetical protein